MPEIAAVPEALALIPGSSPEIPAPPQLLFGWERAIVPWARLHMPRLAWQGDQGVPSVLERAVRVVGVGWAGDVIGAAIYHDLDPYRDPGLSPSRRQLTQMLAESLGAAGYRAIPDYSNREWGACGVELVVVTTHPRWATRPIVRRLLEVAFVDLGCEVLRCRAAVDNRQARRLLLRLGFRRAPGQRGAISLYELRRDECRLFPQHWRPTFVNDRCHLH